MLCAPLDLLLAPARVLGSGSNENDAPHAADESIRGIISRDHPGFREIGADFSNSDFSSAVEYLHNRRLLAVTDSLLMISHAAEKGLDLKQDDIQAILDMASTIDITGKATPDSTLTPELESRFWVAVSRISYLIRPANAVALRERSPLYLSTINYYKRFVWFILIVTLVFHCYYYILGAFLADAKESIQRLDLARAAAFTSIASNQRGPSQPDSSVIINIGNTCEALSSWRIANNWVARFTGQVGSVRQVKDSWSAEEAKLCLDHDANDAVKNLNQLRVVDDRTQMIISWATKVREVVGQFILPLLYGALGAVTSIIRELSISIRQIRYSRAFVVEYGLKIPLGALAGATVGLLIAPETLNTASGLTILGIAFGFGYSVDVFFTLLDGLIGRLTQQEATPQRVPQRNLDSAEIAAERGKESGDRPSV